MAPAWAESESWRSCVKGLASIAAASTDEASHFLSSHLSHDQLAALRAAVQSAVDHPAKSRRPSTARDPGSGRIPELPPGGRPLSAGASARKTGSGAPPLLVPRTSDQLPQVRGEECNSPTSALLTPVQRARQFATRRQQPGGIDATRCLKGEANDQSYQPGILELERRGEALRHVFERWDSSSDVSVEGSGLIEVHELLPVLQCFYGWSDQEASAECERMLHAMDTDCSRTVDLEEFRSFVMRLSRHAPPAQFDHLVVFLIECIGDVSKIQEKRRRLALLGSLFQRWDSDGTGYIELSELRDVLAGLSHSTGKEAEHAATTFLARMDADGDGRLSKSEFQGTMSAAMQPLSANHFDTLRYRLGRLVENARQSRDSVMLGRFLATRVLPAVLESSTPHTPILLFGTNLDPSRAIERLAQANSCVLRPCLITHSKSEKDGIGDMLKYGFQRGHWSYFIIGAGYEADRFLRDVGVRLSTNSHKGTGMVHKRFRLFVSSVERGIMHWPNIITLRSLQVGLESLHPTVEQLEAASREDVEPTDFSARRRVSLPCPPAGKRVSWTRGARRRVTE